MSLVLITLCCSGAVLVGVAMEEFKGNISRGAIQRGATSVVRWELAFRWDSLDVVKKAYIASNWMDDPGRAVAIARRRKWKMEKRKPYYSSVK